MRPRSERKVLFASMVLAGVWAAWYLKLTPSSVTAAAHDGAIMRAFFSAALKPSLISESGSGLHLVPLALEGKSVIHTLKKELIL